MDAGAKVAAVTDEDFAPSIYAADHPTGKIYLQIAEEIISELNK